MFITFEYIDQAHLYGIAIRLLHCQQMHEEKRKEEKKKKRNKLCIQWIRC